MVKQPKSSKETRDVTAFTLEEEKAFLKALESESRIINKFPNDYTVQFLIELFAGLRMGEINALYVEDIDFENDKIYVRRTITSMVMIKALWGELQRQKRVFVKSQWSVFTRCLSLVYNISVPKAKKV